MTIKVIDGQHVRHLALKPLVRAIQAVLHG